MNSEVFNRFRTLTERIEALADRMDGVEEGAGVTISTDAPAPIGTASAGVGPDASASDHVHAHGNQLGGALHADVGAASGFMSTAQATALAGAVSDIADTVGDLAALTTVVAGKVTTNVGNAGTATALQTARNINGVPFDGTAAVTVPAAAGTLTGTTLASNVVTSSLTTVGTIGTGAWQGTAIADSYIASASTWNAKAASGANTDITSVALDQTGLAVKGGSSNKLTIRPNETLSTGRTLSVVTGDADRSLTFAGDATIVGINTGDQTSVSGNAGTATALSAGADRTKLDGIEASAINALAGAGMTKSGSTLNVIANADASIVVNADDIQVGVITNTQHGSRGGGSLHADVVAAGASGFMSGTDKTKLNGIATGATAEVDAAAGVAGRVNNSSQVLGNGNKFLQNNLGITQTSFANYGIDFGSALGNTLVAVYDAGGAPAGFGVSSADVRIHGNSAVAGQISIRPRAADAASWTCDWVTGLMTCGGVAVPTISSSSILTNKAIGAGWSFSGTPTISGNGVFSGGLTLSGAVSLTGAGSGTNKQWKSTPQTAVVAHAGGGQASATAITGDIVFVGTVASAGDSLLLPVTTGGFFIRVLNKTATACNVFPQSGGTINALGANTAISIPANTWMEFYSESATQWYTR